MWGRSALPTIYAFVILQIVFLTESVSSHQSIPICNSKLKGNEITVYGDDWNFFQLRLSSKSLENLNCHNGTSRVGFPVYQQSELLHRGESLDKATAELKEQESRHQSKPIIDAARKKVALHSPKETYFFPDGTLGIIKDGDHHYFETDDYCVISWKFGRNQYFPYNCSLIVATLKGVNTTAIEIQFCEPHCEENHPYHPCIKKCCPYKQSFNPHRGCEPIDGNASYWSAFLYSDAYDEKPLNNSNFKPHYVYYLLDPRCSCNSNQNCHNKGPTQETWYSRTFPSPDGIVEKSPFKILKDGSLHYIDNYRRWVKLDNGHFCIDAIQNYDVESNFSGQGMESEQVVVSCAVDTPQSKLSIVYMVSMYIASIFLLLTCIVYVLLWDKQNVHGWTVFSLVLSMYLWFIFMGTAHLSGILSSGVGGGSEHENSTLQDLDFNSTTIEEISGEDTSSGTVLCTLNAILAHFFFISTFSWLTFINLDLFLTFKSLSSVVGKSKGMKKFISYAVPSWGLPFIVVLVGIILDYKYPDRESLVLTPEYGKAYCFIAPWAQGVYVYYIVSVLLVLNFIFVTTTFFFLYQVKKVTGSIRSNKKNDKQQTFLLVAKLSVVMGITWIFEVISWATTKEHDDTAWYWLIFDMYNLFQAVLIFITFVCKRTIMTQLEQKYPIFKSFFALCGCSKFLSSASKIRKPAGVSGTDASSALTHSTDDSSNWNQASVSLKTMERANADDFDCTIPTLKSFEKAHSDSPLLSKSSK